MGYRFLDGYKQEFGLRWLLKSYTFIQTLITTTSEMRKQDISLKNLIVANGFKHFIMILMVSWDTVNEGISTKRRDLIEHNNSPQIHES